MRIGRMFHRNAQTYLVHVFGRGLEGDRYVIEKYRSLADGQIHAVEAEQPATNARRGKRRTIMSAGRRQEAAARARRDHRVHGAEPEGVRHPVLGDRRDSGLGAARHAR